MAGLEEVRHLAAPERNFGVVDYIEGLHHKADLAAEVLVVARIPSLEVFHNSQKGQPRKDYYLAVGLEVRRNTPNYLASHTLVYFAEAPESFHSSDLGLGAFGSLV